MLRKRRITAYVAVFVTAIYISITISINRLTHHWHDDALGRVNDDLAARVRFTSSVNHVYGYKTLNFMVSGDAWQELSEQRLLCLATHSSMDRFFWILDTVEVWSGPISIALFVPGGDFHVAMVAIDFLRRCHDAVRRQVSFHVVFPQKVDIEIRRDIDDFLTRNASEAKWACSHDLRQGLNSILEALTVLSAWQSTLAFPQNHLRNVAKRGCQTTYTMVTDNDMIPIVDLDLQMEVFLATDDATTCEECAFVVPVFEIDRSAKTLPRDKEALVNLTKAGLAREFHIKVYAENQKASNLTKWLKLPPQTTMGLAYEAKYRQFYEPLYVSRADVPDFEERFVGFGMTRNTQVYEMNSAGYKFFVLNNAFASHWDFQTKTTRPKWRRVQQMINTKKFRRFAEELVARYKPESKSKKWKVKPAKSKSS